MRVTIKTLQRTFITDPQRWLGQSAYFDNLFSGRWGDKQEDGSYYVETDAHVFEHVLRYLRTGVLPVFYDRERGHDFALYQALLEEARYFAIDRLQKWLCERKYLDAVKIHHLATESRARPSHGRHTTNAPHGSTFMVEDSFIEITTSSNMETTMVPVTRQKNSFYCPHRKRGESDEDSCRSCIGQAFWEETDLKGEWRNEEELKWCIVLKEVVFDHDLCVNAFKEDALP